MSSEQNFWSRRKAAVEAEATADTAAQEDAVQAEERAELEAKSDAEILTELNLKDPDTLGPGDDFSGFLKQAVPERLRRRALRKLWLSNPLLANLDELVDYGEDYTDAATVVENLQTAYQVGKGMLKHVIEKDNGQSDESVDFAQSLVSDEPQVAEDLVTEENEVPLLDGDEAEDTPEIDPETELAEPVVRRRMRFEFAETDQVKRGHMAPIRERT